MTGLETVWRALPSLWGGLAITLEASALSVAFALIGGVLLGTARHFAIPRDFALLFPLAATMAAAIGWHSALPGPRRRITWKGRPCKAAPTIPMAPP